MRESTDPLLTAVCSRRSGAVSSLGAGNVPTSLPVGVPRWFPGIAGDSWLDGFYATWRGAWMAVKSRSHSGCQGQATGVRSLVFLALVAMRAGTWMSFWRTVAFLALVKVLDARIPMARARF